MTKKIEVELIYFLKRHSVDLSKIGIFVILFWFGFLKIIGLSPANPLIRSLFTKTIYFVSFDIFLIGFGLFEVLIAILFLLRNLDRLALPLLLLHMICVSMPLILLPEMTWQRFAVPTLEGQYIIKNLMIVVCGIVIAGDLRPLKS